MRCQTITDSGTPCLRESQRGQCWQHYPTEVAARAEWRTVLAMRRPEPLGSVVYFAHYPDAKPGDRCYGSVKIGVTTNLRRRMHRLGTDPIIVLPGGGAIEAELHRRFAHLRWHGEWFRCEADLAAYIDSLVRIA